MRSSPVDDTAVSRQNKSEEPMEHGSLSDGEVIRRGRQAYSERLKPMLEPGEIGRFVVINPRNGDYAIADTTTEAGALMRARYPQEVFYEVRIGYDHVTEWTAPALPDAVGTR